MSHLADESLPIGNLNRLYTSISAESVEDKSIERQSNKSIERRQSNVTLTDKDQTNDTLIRRHSNTLNNQNPKQQINRNPFTKQEIGSANTKLTKPDWRTIKLRLEQSKTDQPSNMPRASRSNQAGSSDEDNSYANSNTCARDQVGNQANLGEVLQQMKNIMELLVNQNQNQPPASPPNNAPTIAMEIQAAVTRASTNEGIWDYEEEQLLTTAKVDFFNQMIRIGATQASAEERFWQSTINNDDLKILSPKNMQHFGYNLKMF